MALDNPKFIKSTRKISQEPNELFEGRRTPMPAIGENAAEVLDEHELELWCDRLTALLLRYLGRTWDGRILPLLYDGKSLSFHSGLWSRNFLWCPVQEPISLRPLPQPNAPGSVYWQAVERGEPALFRRDTGSHAASLGFWPNTEEARILPIFYAARCIAVVGLEYSRECKPARSALAKIEELLVHAASFLRRAILHRDSLLGPGMSPFLLKGHCPAWLEAMRTIEIAAQTVDYVLLLGETGTGKNHVARQIHLESSRGSGPFVHLASGAITESLAEPAIMGSSDDAWTGAKREHLGYVRQASQGTLFVNEIATASERFQILLLRLFDDSTVAPSGKSLPQKVDTRIIAATNQDLEKLVRQGRFRQDLWQRLKALEIRLPPLRTFAEEIPAIAEAYLRFYASQKKQKPPVLSPEAVNLLRQYHYPGNLRELAYAVRRAFLHANGKPLTLEHLPAWLRGHARESDCDLASDEELRFSSFRKEKKKIAMDFERRWLLRVMERVEGNVTKGARLARVSRRYLYKLLAKHGLAYSDIRTPSGVT